MKPSRAELALAALAVAALALLYRVDPQSSRLYPPCPFHFTTGLQCPGCGTARALHQLLHGHVLRALRFNAMAVLLLPLAMYAALARALRGASRGPVPPLPRHGAWAWALLALAVAFGILRNLPAGRFLSPAP